MFSSSFCVFSLVSRDRHFSTFSWRPPLSLVSTSDSLIRRCDPWFSVLRPSLHRNHRVGRFCLRVGRNKLSYTIPHLIYEYFNVVGNFSNVLITNCMSLAYPSPLRVVVCWDLIFYVLVCCLFSYKKNKRYSIFLFFSSDKNMSCNSNI